MANQLSRTDSSSNQDIRQRFNVKKTIIGVIVLLIGLFHLPEAILLIMDGISLDSILYLIGNILLCLLGIYQLKFRSREMRYLPTKSVVKEKNYSFNLKYLEPLKEMIESGNFYNNINIEKGTGGNLRLDVLMSADKKFAAVRLLQFIPYSLPGWITCSILPRPAVPMVRSVLMSPLNRAPTLTPRRCRYRTRCSRRNPACRARFNNPASRW